MHSNTCTTLLLLCVPNFSNTLQKFLFWDPRSLSIWVLSACATSWSHWPQYTCQSTVHPHWVYSHKVQASTKCRWSQQKTLVWKLPTDFGNLSRPYPPRSAHCSQELMRATCSVLKFLVLLGHVRPRRQGTSFNFQIWHLFLFYFYCL